MKQLSFFIFVNFLFAKTPKCFSNLLYRKTFTLQVLLFLINGSTFVYKSF